MTLQPATLAELSRQLAEAHASRSRVTAVNLRSFSAIRDYTPEDMTVTAEAGITLSALQAVLAEKGQWLPIDPAHPERVTVRELISQDLFGPRRAGFGTIREHLIGIEVVLADGRIIHSGGKVVKNVAGYDLLKLFVGARDSLGIITGATFKLRPRPEQELVLMAQFDSLPSAWMTVRALLDSPISAVVLDLHNLVPGRYTIVLVLAGTRTEVEWQRSHVVGFDSPSTAPQHEAIFWSDLPPVHTESVLPSKLPEVLAALGSAPFLARALNGIVHHRGPGRPKPAIPLALARRLKDAFDPRHILPEAPL
jgi:FAD/FMN-containing dehydrogenase